MRYIVFLTALTLAPGAAAQALQCKSSDHGSVTCIERVLCVCGHQRAGTVTGQKADHAWDCGINRPRCPSSVLPAEIEDKSGKTSHRPSEIVVERDGQKITVPLK